MLSASEAVSVATFCVDPLPNDSKFRILSSQSPSLLYWCIQHPPKIDWSCQQRNGNRGVEALVRYIDVDGFLHRALDMAGVLWNTTKGVRNDICRTRYI